jgi:chromosome segregation ATPase
VTNYDVIRAREEELNSQVLTKDVTIGNLKSMINELQQDKNRDISDKNALERRVERLTEEIQILKDSQKGLNGTIQSLENKVIQYREKYEQLEGEVKTGDSKLKDKEKEEGQLRRDHSQLKQKLDKVELDHE